jgi:AraC family transcriptional regulator
MHPSYADFYAVNYAPYIQDLRLIGGANPIGMFIADQPPGDFPDEPLQTYNLQLNISLYCAANADIGVGKNWVKLRNGDICLSPPDTAATFDVITRSHLMGLGIPKGIVENAAAYLGVKNFNPESLLRSGHSDPVIARLMKDCWYQGKGDAPDGALFVDANLMAIAVRIVALSQKGAVLSPPVRVADLTQQIVDHIADFVDTHIDAEIRVATLASIANIPEYGFARAFRAFTGLSPHQWVMERRITHAALLLRIKTHSVAEVAYAAGFSSQAHMTTVFAKRMGLTPAVYRRENSR